MAKILVVGSLNVDLTVKVKALPQKGQTLMGESLEHRFGGKGANQALAVAKLGGDVKLLGCLGEDTYASSILESLSSQGVDVSSVECQKGAETGLAIIALAQTGENQIIVLPGANALCNTSYLQKWEAEIQKAEYILLQQEIPLESITFVLDKAKQYGKTVFLNPAPALNAFPEEWKGKVDYLLPNWTEYNAMEKFCGLYSEDGFASRKMQELGLFKHLVLTMGEEGVSYYHDEEECHCQAFKVDVKDTVAAGDTFIGALVLALSKNKAIEDALHFASAAAAISVTREGAQSSMPNRQEVEAFMATNSWGDVIVFEQKT